MNRLVRALLGVVVAKAAIASAWYLYQKSTEHENDWKTEGEPEKNTQPNGQSEPKTVEIKEEKPTVVDNEVVKPKRVRKNVAEKTESKSVEQKAIRNRTKKAQ